MNTLWKSVNASRSNEKFEGCKLLIASQSWTHNPDYTLHSITYQQPKGFDNVFLTNVRVINPNCSAEERANINEPESPFITFICSKMSAMALFLVLTPEQRKELIETLHISFDCTKYQSSEAFKDYILGTCSLEQFKDLQEEIKKLMLSEINPAKYIATPKDNEIKDVIHDLSQTKLF